MLRKIGTKKSKLSEDALGMVAARFRALGDPTRLRLIQVLFDGERTVLELCRLTDMSQANVSKHLSILTDQGLLARRKEGLYVYYSIADESLHELCTLVCDSLSARFTRVQQAFKAKPLRKSR